MSEQPDGSNGITRTDELLRRLLSTHKQVGELVGISRQAARARVLGSFRSGSRWQFPADVAER